MGPLSIKAACAFLVLIFLALLAGTGTSYHDALTQCEKTYSTETCINQLRP